MESTKVTCEHRWHYFVHLKTRAVRVRECAHCGLRDIMPVPAPVAARATA